MDNKTRQTLKASAHKLKPLVIVGNHGLTEAVQQEIDCALNAHELIKIRVNAESKEIRQHYIDAICRQQNATLINVTGHVAIIYRQGSQ